MTTAGTGRYTSEGTEIATFKQLQSYHLYISH